MKMKMKSNVRDRVCHIRKKDNIKCPGLKENNPLLKKVQQCKEDFFIFADVF
jgi:hypothetical protein